MRVKTRVAIVIAADTPIGRAVAATVVRNGVAVVVNYTRHRAAAQQLVLDIHAYGGAAVAVQASTTVKSQVEALFDATSEFFDRVDLVVFIADASRGSEPNTPDMVWRTDELHVLAEAARRIPA
jgi:NAD(P)-dependent dehydrogenase (short-subunit alcohol dehydrogenase family)